jgi:hypothetical protein
MIIIISIINFVISIIIFITIINFIIIAINIFTKFTINIKFIIKPIIITIIKLFYCYFHFTFSTLPNVFIKMRFVTIKVDFTIIIVNISPNNHFNSK